MSEVYISYIGPVFQDNIDLLLSSIFGYKNDGFSRINVELSTVGGDPQLAIAAYNALRGIGRMLRFYNIGNVDSAGVPLFMAADNRVACPHSTFMLHELTWHFFTPQIHARDVKPHLDNLTYSQEKMIGIIADRTCIRTDDLAVILEQGAVLNANAAAARRFVQCVEEVVVPDEVEIRHIFPIKKL